MSEVNLDQTRAIERAHEEGFKVYRGRPNRLLLDLDNDNYQAGLIDLEFVEKFIGLTEIKRWDSKSGNTHVIYELDRELTVPERLVLQLLLGSDPKREMYCLARFWEGQVEPSLLFRPKRSKVVKGGGDRVATRKKAVDDTYGFGGDDETPF